VTAPTLDHHAAAEPAECTECGRPLKRPTVDGLGPVCRRKLRAERAEQAPAPTPARREPGPGQLDLDDQAAEDTP